MIIHKTRIKPYKFPTINAEKKTYELKDYALDDVINISYGDGFISSPLF